jgi:hypothetical protein
MTDGFFPLFSLLLLGCLGSLSQLPLSPHHYHSAKQLEHSSILKTEAPCSPKTSVSIIHNLLCTKWSMNPLFPLDVSNANQFNNWPIMTDSTLMITCKFIYWQCFLWQKSTKMCTKFTEEQLELLTVFFITKEYKNVYKVHWGAAGIKLIPGYTQCFHLWMAISSSLKISSWTHGLKVLISEYK